MCECVIPHTFWVWGFYVCTERWRFDNTLFSFVWRTAIMGKWYSRLLQVEVGPSISSPGQHLAVLSTPSYQQCPCYETYCFFIVLAEKQNETTNLEPQLLVVVIRALEDSTSNLHLAGWGRVHITLHRNHPVTKHILLQSLPGSVFRVKNKGESTFGQEK